MPAASRKAARMPVIHDRRGMDSLAPGGVCTLEIRRIFPRRGIEFTASDTPDSRLTGGYFPISWSRNRFPAPKVRRDDISDTEDGGRTPAVKTAKFASCAQVL